MRSTDRTAVVMVPLMSSTALEEGFYYFFTFRFPAGCRAVFFFVCLKRLFYTDEIKNPVVPNTQRQIHREREVMV